MRSRCMSLLPRTTLHSDSEQLVYFMKVFCFFRKITEVKQTPVPIVGQLYEI
jgi:hypothetical protein